MTDLNLAGESHAHSLIAAGKVDKTSAWSFSAEEGNALLGKNGDDWASYGQAHLGLDRAATDKTKSRFKYPFAKGGKIYRSAVIAIKQRAAQQSDAAIEKSATSLLVQLDKPSMASRRIEGKITPFEFKFLDTNGSSMPGAFEGYASVFGNTDDYGDVIHNGAFKDTLAKATETGKMPKMLLNHGGLAYGTQTAESLLPIGGWDQLSEDSKGLAGRGHLINLDTDFGKRLYGAMKDGQLDGMSITYSVKSFTPGSKASGIRRNITSVDLIEAGPVTFPANTAALINEVKSAAQSITTIREFEDFLRDVGRFSNAAAKAIAASGFKANTPEPRDEDGNGENLAALINRAAEKIRP